MAARPLLSLRLPRVRIPLLAGLWLLLAAGVASAQGTAISIGDGHDPDAPVEVTAESLAFDQDTGNAVFSGEVLILQGDMKLAAPKVEVTYDPDSADNEIQSMLASGGVVFTSSGEVAESETATYTPESGRLVMRGNVIVTQGRTALTSESLDVDLETGNGVLTGRVRAVFRSQ